MVFGLCIWLFAIGGINIVVGLIKASPLYFGIGLLCINEGYKIYAYNNKEQD